MRNALGWWWYTPHDLLDKIDEKNLMRDTRVYAHTLWRLLTDPVLPLDFFATHADVLVDELGKLRTSLGDRFSVADLLASAEALRAKAAGGGHSDAALIRASRALAPVYYPTSGDRFAHDPALPLHRRGQRAGSAYAKNLRRLHPGTDSARFLAVSATRGRNRLAHALREATEALSSL